MSNDVNKQNKLSNIQEINISVKKISTGMKQWLNASQ